MINMLFCVILSVVAVMVSAVFLVLTVIALVLYINGKGRNK